MESATFSSIRASKMDYEELTLFLRPEEASDMDLIRAAFDAANKGQNGDYITVYHKRAINELMDRFVGRQIKANMWEASEALRELKDVEERSISDGAKETLLLMKEELEFESIGHLMAIVMTASLHREDRKTANAIRCLREHFTRDHFRYDDEEHLSILLYRMLSEEKDPKVLFEAACTIEALGKKEALPHIRFAINGRGWEEFSEVRRKLVSIERKLSVRFGENPVEIVNQINASRRRVSSPPSREDTRIIPRKVGGA